MTPDTTPATAPPVLHGQRPRADEEHLRLLAIFHFVGAGFALLALMFLGLHYIIMHTVMTNPQMWQNNRAAMPQAPFPAGFFAFFQLLYFAGALWFITSGVLNVISGFCLRARTNRTFSLIVAGFNCLYLPLGTALGIFTIIVLTRNSVRELYGD